MPTPSDTSISIGNDNGSTSNHSSGTSQPTEPPSRSCPDEAQPATDSDDDRTTEASRSATNSPDPRWTRPFHALIQGLTPDDSFKTATDEPLEPGGAEQQDDEDDDSEDASAEGFIDEPTLGYEYSTTRIIPTSPSSFLRPGSKFHGTQQSERQVYDVQVEIKYVDLRESFLCGYLKIQGLTEDNPTLTTYFEGEMIGTKYTFFTEHEDWGANRKTDLSHWSKFSAFRPFRSYVQKGIHPDGLATSPYIFMRWKEHFLVPDHRVRTINGASFEGFYYICFNMKEGLVSGIYFHSKSEKFQQLELKHVEDRGCYGSVEFR